MRLFLLKFLLSMSFTLNAFAANVDIVGAVIKDKKTKEILALTCVGRSASNNACTSYQYLLLNKVSKDNYQVLMEVGSVVGVADIKREAENIKDDLYNDYELYNAVHVATGESDLTDVALDSSLIGLMVYAMDQGNIVGKTLGFLGVPIALAVDFLRLGGEVVFAGSEIVAEVAVAATIGVSVFANNSFATINSNKAKKALIRTYQMSQQGKTTRLNHKNFNAVLNALK